LSKLLEAESAASAAYSARLAKQLTHIPAGDLLIRNARLFDPRDLSVTPGMSVLIRNEHIVRVAPDAALKATEKADIVEAAGRFLMPGLWDNHQHFSDNDGALDLANGVTSARDMANDTDEFLQRVATIRHRSRRRWGLHRHAGKMRCIAPGLPHQEPS
jgi:predicted amidohydrolase YtcJ